MIKTRKIIKTCDWFLQKGIVISLGLSAGLLQFLIASPDASAEWDDWITDVYIGVERIENINHALSFTKDDKNDTLLNPQFVFGRVFQVSNHTRLIFTANLDAKVHQEYNKLNSTTLGGGVVLFHKFGTGFDKPWLRANVDMGYMNVVDDLRTSSLVNAGLRTGMRFLPWLDGWIAYEYFMRDGGNGTPVPPTYGGPYVIETDVFDLTRNTIRVNLNAHPLQDVTVTAGYSLARGDFTASCSESNLSLIQQFETYEAIAVDEAFKDDAGNNFCVYRVGGDATTVSLDASYALGRRSSVNLGYQQQKTEAKVYSYDTKVYRLNYMYTF